MRQQNYPTQSWNEPTEPTKEKLEEQKKGPLKCWGCGEAHMLREFPHRKNDTKRIYIFQEAIIVDDVAKSVPQIYVVVKNRQVDHQASIVELEGIITKQPISIMIDPGSNLIYIALQIVEACVLQKRKHPKSWLVQLAIRTKRKVIEVIGAYQFEIMDCTHKHP
jgi:hypothetical protein